jgi:hypothetical protein
MSDPTRHISKTDRAVAGGVLAAGSVLLVLAPVLLGPWALEQGRQSPRFALFAIATIAAWWLGSCAVRTVARRLRTS